MTGFSIGNDQHWVCVLGEPVLKNRYVPAIYKAKISTYLAACQGYNNIIPLKSARKWIREAGKDDTSFLRSDTEVGYWSSKIEDALANATEADQFQAVDGPAAETALVKWQPSKHHSASVGGAVFAGGMSQNYGDSRSSHSPLPPRLPMDRQSRPQLPSRSSRRKAAKDSVAFANQEKELDKEKEKKKRLQALAEIPHNLRMVLSSASLREEPGAQVLWMSGKGGHTRLCACNRDSSSSQLRGRKEVKRRHKERKGRSSKKAEE